MVPTASVAVALKLMVAGAAKTAFAAGTVMFAGAPSTALLGGAVMLTPGGASTRMLTAAEVVLKPRLSVARAVSACVPAARLERVTLKGAAIAVPTSAAPSKKSTFATVPSVSDALALTVTLAGAMKSALLAGAVMLTVGGVSTVIVTGAEVVAIAFLSVAFAVSV